MEKKKKNAKAQRVLPLGLMVLLGVCCGVGVSVLMDQYSDVAVETGNSLMISGGIFLSIFVSMILQTIIHEAGHLIFGLLSGYRFGSFRVFNLMWIKEDGVIRLRRMSVAGTAGQCLMVPPEPVDGKFPVVLYNLGGSILNGAVSVVFFLLFLILKPYPMLSGPMLIFAMMGMILGLSNGIPMMTAFVPNDGYNAISLKRNPHAMKAFWLQLKIMEQTSKGVRLKEMPPEWFEVPTDEAMKNSMVCTMGVLACNRLMDEMKLEEADRLMERLLQADIAMIGLHRNLLICDRICLEAVGQNRPEVLDAMLTKEYIAFQKKMNSSPTVLRTMYACALLRDRDQNKAQKLKARFEKVAQKYPYPCELQSEYELFRMVDSKFNKIS